MPRFRLLLKAEYALLFLAVLCFGVTVVFRAKAAKIVNTRKNKTDFLRFIQSVYGSRHGLNEQNSEYFVGRSKIL